MAALRFKKIIFGSLLSLLALPMIQVNFGFFSETPLAGYFELAEKPELNQEDWYEGKYQPDYTKFIEDHVGFRSFFVRLNNQFDFSLFQKPNGDGVVIGKNGNFFIQSYIDAFYGKDFVGRTTADDRMRKLRFLQDTWEKKNIAFVLVFAPGKASFYPEDIPAQLGVRDSAMTNYKYYLKKCDDLGIHYIDFNRWFRDLKKKQPKKYLYYPQYGTHLSTYGSSVLSDSLVRYIERTLHEDLPDLIYGPEYTSDTVHGSDYDISDLINLFTELRNPPMTFPRITFIQDSTKHKPHTLAVGDSYYMGLLGTNIPQAVFNDGKYWQYNKRVYPESFAKETMVKDLDLKAEVEKQEMIIIMATEATLHKLSYGFIEDAYSVYCPKNPEDKKAYYREMMTTDKQWKQDIDRQAKAEHITTDSLINRQALVLVADELKSEEKYKAERIAYFEDRIRKDPAYMALIIGKAKEKMMTVDEMIRQDAEWLYSEEKRK